MTILLTGGTGYIGSHTAVELIVAGENVVLLDNLANSSAQIVERIERITGHKPPFYQGDIRDRAILQRIFREHPIDTVMHFAGLKAVGESVREPLAYYDNNVSGSLILLQEMAQAGIRNIVFSSSATVYGTPASVPITETMPTGQTSNPYGSSKHMVEGILTDLQVAQSAWSVVLLRYFNPAGAHPSGLIGENPRGIPNNLLPYVCQVASGKLPQLNVFGGDYPTTDGTGIRDYIHVCDLARGHLAACRRHRNDGGLHVYNLGTGQGYSVLDIIRAFEQANGLRIPYQIVARREGDIAVCYADSSKAQRELQWQTQHSLEDMMRDSWHWQSLHPDGLA